MIHVHIPVPIENLLLLYNHKHESEQTNTNLTSQLANIFTRAMEVVHYDSLMNELPQTLMIK